jgi:hypothetical protein
MSLGVILMTLVVIAIPLFILWIAFLEITYRVKHRNDPPHRNYTQEQLEEYEADLARRAKLRAMTSEEYANYMKAKLQ